MVQYFNRIKKEIDAIVNTYLFDFDGTLVDSMPNWSTVMKRILDDYNIPYPDDIIRILTPLGTVNSAKYYVELGVPLSQEEIIGLMGKHMLDEYWYRIPAKENVIEVLTKLKSEGCSLNILTASPHITLDPCLKRLGMWELFSNIWSSDDFNTSKNNPDIYKEAAKKLNTRPENILFVDDNINACKAGKLGGVTVCGVYDETSKDIIDEIKSVTDFYIYNFSELPNLDL